MPIYRANGNRYNIPDDKIQDFERRYPESKVEMYDGEGKKYAIPLSKRNKFQQRYVFEPVFAEHAFVYVTAALHDGKQPDEL